MHFESKLHSKVPFASVTGEYLAADYLYLYVMTSHQRVVLNFLEVCVPYGYIKLGGVNQSFEMFKYDVFNGKDQLQCSP
jgi:hypothetical protein